MLKVEFSSARCSVEGHWTSEGSVFAGTIAATCHGIETHLEIESDDDPARVAAMVRNARQGCYAEATVSDPVPVAATVSLNGDPLDFSAYPRRVERRR